MRRIGAAALYEMELAGREMGAGDRLLVYDPERGAFFFRVDDMFALSREEADYEWLAKFAIWM